MLKVQLPTRRRLRCILGFHKWLTISVLGAYRYEQCSFCPNRRAVRTELSGHVPPPDLQWVAGGDGQPGERCSPHFLRPGGTALKGPQSPGNITAQIGSNIPYKSESRMLRVYIAGPYSSNPEANTLAAIAAGAVLIRAGYAPFVPHLSHYVEQQHPQPYETWMQLDFAWLAVCDAIVRLPGASSGADREVDRARQLGIPVYFSVEEFLATRDGAVGPVVGNSTSNGA